MVAVTSPVALARVAPLQDPFAPGLRWTRAASAARPWIPRSLALGADDNLVWLAAGGASQHVELVSAHSSGAAQPMFRDDGPAAAWGSLLVAAGRGARAFFSAVQYPQPDALHRATKVARYAPDSAALGSPFVPAWSHDCGLLTNGPARLACDEAGARVIVAVWNSATHEVALDVLDGSSGALGAHAALSAAALNELVLSADGSRAAVSAGLDLWILDAGLSVLHHETLASSTQALSLSGDGRKLAVGGLRALRVLADGGSGYAQAFQVGAAQDELSSRAALSRDGRTLAIGWWSFATGVDLRFEVIDVLTHARLYDIAQTGTIGGLQNLPEIVRVTDDGQRIAFGCWGDGTPKPEVLLCDRGSPLPLLSIDLPGSVQALALDASGTRLAVGSKSAHANQFATTGEVRLYDTGESDLFVQSPPRAGGTLEVTARHAGASEVLFLLGRRGSSPIHVAGTEGQLWLRRSRLSLTPAIPDANGRASISLLIANDPLVIGTEWHLQAAFRVNGVLVFGVTVVDPLIL